MFAENDATLRDQLRSNSLYLIQFKKTAESSEKSREGLFKKKKVKLGEMVVMSRQLATLVRAGLPIVETLATLKAQTENPVLSDALGQIQSDILSGSTLNGAMSKHPAIFGKLYIALVSAGEAGGILEKTLDIVADQLEKEAVIREQVKAAMAYPKMVVAASVGVIAFMLVFIVPTFGKVYKQFNAELPFVTLALVSISNFVMKSWWLMFIMIFVAVKGFIAFKNTASGTHFVDTMTLKLPILGPVLRKIAVSRFTQTFAGATRCGIPILHGLAVAADTTGNTIIRAAVLKAAAHVSEGAPLAPTLDESGQFPAMVTRMIAAGEKSGNLDEMLDEITKFYHRDVDYSIGKMTKLIEPLMTVLVGGIVLFVLMALYMPVFNLGKVIKK
jgi:type IV pilus assembly protein PilC